MLDENEISKRLVEFCNENITFKKNLVALFTDRQTLNKDEVSKIEFTGNTQTDYGEPDITITFSSGFKYYIEVKTRKSRDFEDNQTAPNTGYAALIKAKKQKTDESLGYLLDNEHDTNDCLKKCIIVYWQQVLELVNDFKNKSLAKDIAQNVDGITSDEKLFGPDEELFGNPYQLAIFNNTVLKLQKNERIKNNWIFNTFLLPALKNVIDKDAYLLPDSDKETGQKTLYAIFKKDNKEFWLNYDITWISEPESYELCSFTFYRPWIMGVRTATKEAQLKEMTKKSLKLYLIDFKNNINNEQYVPTQIGDYSKLHFGRKSEIYGNPYVFANLVDWLYDGEEIYDDIVIPVLKKMANVTLEEKNIKGKENDYRYIQIKYNNVEIKFNIFNFWNSKINKYIDYHSFIFYRPWIVGVHKAKTEAEMREDTKQSFEIWFEDLKLDNYL